MNSATLKKIHGQGKSMVEKLENAIARNPFVVVVLLLLAGGGGTFAGRLTAPSQDAKIAVLEERIVQLCEMKNDLKLILSATQKIEYFDKRLEEMSRRIQDLEKKISLVFEIDAAYRSVKEGTDYGLMRKMLDRN
jgi:hypothetical protein